MSNPFESRTSGLAGPARDIQPIVPNDTTDLSEVAVALYVETGGDISVVTVAGQTRSFRVADMMILPLGVVRVNSTGTTASGIHGFTI